MRARLKAKWVEALRSGRYRQAQGALYRGTKFCCLGILCDVDGQPWGPAARVDSDAGVIKARPYEGSYFQLDDNQLSRFGLSSDAQFELVRQNDCRVPFAEIADWIEAHVGEDGE